jgi:hypothetical protein
LAAFLVEGLAGTSPASRTHSLAVAMAVAMWRQDHRVNPNRRAGINPEVQGLQAVEELLQRMLLKTGVIRTWET